MESGGTTLRLLPSKPKQAAGPLPGTTPSGLMKTRKADGNRRWCNPTARPGGYEGRKETLWKFITIFTGAKRA